MGTNHERERPGGRTRWDQGFGTIRVGTVEVVPFLTEETCRRIAANATEATGLVVLIMTYGGMWVYSAHRREEARS